MAVPPTPGSLLASSRLLVAWGTRIDSSARSPVDKLAELISSRFDIPLAESLEELRTLSTEHRYVLVRCLGASRHSAVYAAVDSLLARHVAVKIHRAVGDDADNRVLAEVRAASRLNHPNIVRIYDLGVHDGWLFSVTELCDEDMGTWCRRHGWVEILARILEAGEGLAGLHAAGIIHGDVKPPNVFVMNGVAKLADFGMASAPGQSRIIAGTPGYIAPEVAAGFRTANGDVFALAATAWACLFGGLPYGSLPPDIDPAGAIQVSVERAMRAAFAEPQREHPSMPTLVRDEIERGLDWDPGRRPSLEDWLGRLKVLHAWGVRWEKIRARLPWASGWSSRRAVAFVVGMLLAFGGLTAHLVTRAESSTDSSAALGVRDPLELLVDATPRLRARVLACAGDGAGAVDALHDAWGQFETLSPSARIELANSATAIAERLQQVGQLEHAQIAWGLAMLLHGRVGQFDMRTEAFRKIEQLHHVLPITTAPTQNK